MFMTPLLTLYFALTKLNKVEDPNFKAKYGSLYEGLKTDSKIHLLCNFIFTSRRAILIVVTVFLTDYPGIQIMIYIFFAEINIIYLIQFKPYEDSATNYNEIFNEGCVLAASYQLFAFTDFVDDLDSK